MNEEFITYQQAVALKECGFDWECDRYYTNGYANDDPEDLTREVKLHTANLCNHNMFIRESLCYSAPTLALAQKWLREEKGIDIIVTLFRDIDVRVEPFKISRLYEVGICFGESHLCTGKCFSTYESALSDGIDAALELIKQK